MTATNAVLLDTCALIWLATAFPMKAEAEAAIERAGLEGEVLVSAASGWEIGLLTRARPDGSKGLELDEPVAAWLRRLLERPALRSIPLSIGAALAASSLPLPFHADPADRLLVATARELDVPIVTRDCRILAYAEAGHVGALAC